MDPVFKTLLNSHSSAYIKPLEPTETSAQIAFKKEVQVKWNKMQMHASALHRNLRELKTHIKSLETRLERETTHTIQWEYDSKIEDFKRTQERFESQLLELEKQQAALLNTIYYLPSPVASGHIDRCRL